MKKTEIEKLKQKIIDEIRQLSYDKFYK